MSLMRTTFLQCPPCSISPFQTPSSCSGISVSMKFSVSCCSVALPVTVVNGIVDKKPHERNEVRLGLPSKGRMATDNLDLFKDCQLSVKQVNPQQYVAEIPQVRPFISVQNIGNCIYLGGVCKH